MRMTVRSLIAALNTCEPDLEVRVKVPEQAELAYLDGLILQNLQFITLRVRPLEDRNAVRD